MLEWLYKISQIIKPEHLAQLNPGLMLELFELGSATVEAVIVHCDENATPEQRYKTGYKVACELYDNLDYWTGTPRNDPFDLWIKNDILPIWLGAIYNPGGNS